MVQVLPVGGRDAVRRDADALEYLPGRVGAGAGLGVGEERGEVGWEYNLAVRILGHSRERIGIVLGCEAQNAQLELVIHDGELLVLDGECQVARTATALDRVFKLRTRHGDVHVGISLGVRQRELQELVEVSG